MDRVQLVLLGLPILLFCSDLVTLFGPEQLPTPQPDLPPHPSPDAASDAVQPDDIAADAAASAQIAVSPSLAARSSANFDLRSSLN
jgi:hypothetical protein